MSFNCQDRQWFAALERSDTSDLYKEITDLDCYVHYRARRPVPLCAR